ncbi:acyl-CoA dehydrogenase family protein [Chondromyces crocatus]|uniref:Acyl-CoA dehydrogenase n=1 Tax=Chondromyces crocatus TaxID=52 RepID=A0A0K1E5Z9_CHOCO|nr:acyl-CoA dehydrogenase family protein [Chondromyces crocatus]AKT36300.1 acyl-CoA dehydrogenase [Chondromyces crocatus]
MSSIIDRSLIKTLFQGVATQEGLFPFPEVNADERERVAALLDRVRRYFKAHVDSARIDQESRIPNDVLEGLKSLGLMGLRVPPRYGGTGLSNTAYARVTQELGGLDAAVAATLGAHQTIGLTGILRFGSNEQKQRFLPGLAVGAQLAAFALTESNSGSDTAAVRTSAIRSPDGSHYVLQGSKRWVTNGGMADVFTIIARTSAPEEGNKPRLTAFLVERGPGVRSGPEERKLGIRGASTTEIVLESARVPTENMLSGVGQGFPVAMECLNSGRLSIAAGCLGACQALLQLAIERVQERRAFGRHIGGFGLIKDKVATMLASTYALESMVYATTGMLDAGQVDGFLEIAICKLSASETLWVVANETLQIAAGIGYAQNYPYERLLRDARSNLILGGTSEILRTSIAVSAMGHVRQERESATPIRRKPSQYLGILGDLAAHKARSVLERVRTSRVHPQLRHEAAVYEARARELGACVERALQEYGHEVSEMQSIHKRLTDIAMDLFGLGACLARTTRMIERRGEEGARREVDATKLFARMAQQRMQQQMTELQTNDDPLRNSVAERAYADRAYPFDIL